MMPFTAWLLFRGESSACQCDTQPGGHKGVCRDTEEFAETQNNVPAHRGECRDTEKLPGTQSSVQEYKGVYSGTKCDV